MYCAIASPKSVSIQFESSFIHCKGIVAGRHFVKEQANKIKELLITEINFSKILPDVFVITPFSEISHVFNSFLFKYLINEVKKYNAIDSTEMGEWLKNHIGTVHTFQGKQAEGVILCPGLNETTKRSCKLGFPKSKLIKCCNNKSQISIYSHWR